MSSSADPKVTTAGLWYEIKLNAWEHLGDVNHQPVPIQFRIQHVANDEEFTWTQVEFNSSLNKDYLYPIGEDNKIINKIITQENIPPNGTKLFCFRAGKDAPTKGEIAQLFLEYDATQLTHHIGPSKPYLES